MSQDWWQAVDKLGMALGAAALAVRVVMNAQPKVKYGRGGRKRRNRRAARDAVYQQKFLALHGGVHPRSLLGIARSWALTAASAAMPSADPNSPGSE